MIDGTMAPARRNATRRTMGTLTLTLVLATACGGGAAANDGAPPSASAAGVPTTTGETTRASAGSGGAAVQRATACRTNGRLRVLMVGTSLTAGYGLDPEQAYPAMLQKKADSAGFDVEIVNAGVSGETSAGALQRADWLLRAPLDVFYLETGANDGLRAFDPDATRENVQAILTKARAAHPDAQLLLVQMEAPTNLGPRYTSRFRAVFPAAARDAGATLVPFLLDRVAGNESLNQGDGIHPNLAGERIVADNVWPALARALAAAKARRGALDPCPG